jgi:hypothetical protein
LQFHKTYNRWYSSGSFWIRGDFGKPGMEYAEPRPRNVFFGAHIHSIRLSHGGNCDEAAVLMKASPNAPRGAPQTLIIRYRGSEKT